MQLLQCKLIKTFYNFVEIVQIQAYMQKFLFKYTLNLKNCRIITKMFHSECQHCVLYLITSHLRHFIIFQQILITTTFQNLMILVYVMVLRTHMLQQLTQVS